MRILLVLAALLLTACPPVRSNDDDSSCTTELKVCATYGESPATGGTAGVRTGPGDEGPLETPLDAEGCATFTLDEGAWEWRAADSSGTCVSVWEEVSVPGCETTEVSEELVNWCMDG